MQKHHHNHHYTFTITIITTIFLSLLSTAIAASQVDLLRTSCIHARYPTLCVQTLSSALTTPSTTPLSLAQAAVKVTLSHATTLSSYLNTLQSQLLSPSPSPSLVSTKRERVAVTDCATQLSNSVDELNRTLTELNRMRVGMSSFSWHMNNAQTWTSAALTNGDTCLEGFKDGGGDGGNGKVALDVKRRVNGVAMLTSNALYLITRLGGDNGGVGGKPHHIATSNNKN